MDNSAHTCNTSWNVWVSRISWWKNTSHPPRPATAAVQSTMRLPQMHVDGNALPAVQCLCAPAMPQKTCGIRASHNITKTKVDAFPPDLLTEPSYRSGHRCMPIRLRRGGVDRIERVLSSDAISVSDAADGNKRRQPAAFHGGAPEARIFGQSTRIQHNFVFIRPTGRLK